MNVERSHGPSLAFGLPEKKQIKSPLSNYNSIQFNVSPHVHHAYTSPQSDQHTKYFEVFVQY